MEVKRCSRCSEVKPVSEFHRKKSSKDGLFIWCKACVKKQNDKRHSEHRAEEAEYSRNYRRNHADSCNASNRRYRERKITAGGGFSAMEAARCLAFFDYRCAYSGLPLDNDYQFDHVIPVSQGGKNDIVNRVPCLPTINLSKSSRDMEEWYVSQPFYSAERHARIREWISAQ